VKPFPSLSGSSVNFLKILELSLKNSSIRTISLVKACDSVNSQPFFKGWILAMPARRLAILQARYLLNDMLDSDGRSAVRDRFKHLGGPMDFTSYTSFLCFDIASALRIFSSWRGTSSLDFKLASVNVVPRWIHESIVVMVRKA
jgi:hypothetical protein